MLARIVPKEQTDPIDKVFHDLALKQFNTEIQYLNNQ